MAVTEATATAVAATEPLVGEPAVPDTLSGLTSRSLLTRYLTGTGIELGPGHHPMDLPFGNVEVRYLDRWEPVQNRELFPELGDGAEFPKPDLIANLDTDRLGMLSDASQDFVIASHILEHMADPLGQLQEIHRVLRPGGVLLLLLPDRRRTFDATRPPTPLDHLIEDHRCGITSVSDEHIEEYLRHTGSWNEDWDGRPDDPIREAFFDLHRERSIHVHCWTEHEFVAVLQHAATDMGMQWELFDAVFVEDVETSPEFGFVLRRSFGHTDAGRLSARLAATYTALWGRSVRLRAEVAASQAIALDFQARLQELEMTRLFRYTARPRRWYGRVRRGAQRRRQ